MSHGIRFDILGVIDSEVMTVWVALSPSNSENGVMKFQLIRKKNQMAHQTIAADNLLSRGQKVKIEVDESGR